MIKTIIGCMFSGKTTELLREASTYESIGKSIMYVSPILDTRSNDLQTHDRSRSATCIKLGSLSEIFKMDLTNIDVICIDEAQFFEGVEEFILESEKRFHDKILLFACLSGDADRKPWACVAPLIALSDEIRHLTAYCSVRRDGVTRAPFSKRLPAVEGTRDGNKVDIGGADKYQAVCREEYLK